MATGPAQAKPEFTSGWQIQGRARTRTQSRFVLIQAQPIIELGWVGRLKPAQLAPLDLSFVNTIVEDVAIAKLESWLAL